MRVLSFNVGYFLGFHSQRDWLRRPHRAFRADRWVERSALDALVELVRAETPDVVALQEVDVGSVRTTLGDQSERIVTRFDDDGLTYQSRADCKYGPDRVISRLPGFRHMSNMVCWRSGDARARAEYVPPGTKQLVHVVERDGPTVVSVHLPTTSGTRQQQLERLAEVVSAYERVVVVGDFNLFDGHDELAPLTDDLGFDLFAPGKTYPTADPEHAFDVLLASPGVSVTGCEVLDDVGFSDHLPLVADVE